MDLKLVFPSEKFEVLWYDIVNEFENAGEIVSPRSLAFRQNDFNVFLNRTREIEKGINLGNLLPSTTFLLVDEKEERIFGAINIRPHLNEDYYFRNGHIGYGIRPSERRKGYAVRMLSMALAKCKDMGLNKVLVTCNKDNLASARTIEKNGGIFENEVTEENGNIVRRYWITIY